MKWAQGRIVRKRVWSEGLFTIVVDVPGVDEFEAGQFLQLGLQQDEKHIHRPYSVASPHGRELDFFIVLVENGALTPLIWELGEGDELDVSTRAAGSFTLSHCPDAQTLWLMATGTGLAPYVAMLRTEDVWDRYDQVVVVHGVRYSRDLAYQDEFEQHRLRLQNRFRYIPIISREELDESLKGRITANISSGELEDLVGRQIDSDSCIMLCGNPDMLDETEQLLGERGLRRHKKKEPGQIVVERYW